MNRKHAAWIPRNAPSYFAFRLGELAAFQKASYAVAYVGGCCHPPLADSAFRVPPVPGRHAPGSMEKIKPGIAAVSPAPQPNTQIIAKSPCKSQGRDFEKFRRDGTSRRSLIFVWLIQSRFYATRIKSLIKNSPDNHAVTLDLVVYALMESVCQSAVISEMDLVIFPRHPEVCLFRRKYSLGIARPSLTQCLRKNT